MAQNRKQSLDSSKLAAKREFRPEVESSRESFAPGPFPKLLHQEVEDIITMFA